MEQTATHAPGTRDESRPVGRSRLTGMRMDSSLLETAALGIGWACVRLSPLTFVATEPGTGREFGFRGSSSTSTANIGREIAKDARHRRTALTAAGVNVADEPAAGGRRLRILVVGETAATVVDTEGRDVRHEVDDAVLNLATSAVAAIPGLAHADVVVDGEPAGVADIDPAPVLSRTLTPELRHVAANALVQNLAGMRDTTLDWQADVRLDVVAQGSADDAVVRRRLRRRARELGVDLSLGRGSNAVSASVEGPLESVGALPALLYGGRTTPALVETSVRESSREGVA